MIRRTVCPPFLLSPLIQVIMGLVLFIALINGQRDLVILTFLAAAVIARRQSVGQKEPFQHHVVNCRPDRIRVFPEEPVLGEHQNSQPKISAGPLSVRPAAFRRCRPSGTLFSQNECRNAGFSGFRKPVSKGTVSFPKRGWYTIGPPRVTAGDLLGVLYAG